MREEPLIRFRPAPRRALACALAAVLVASAAIAGAELVLRDGSVIQGAEIERQADNYLVTRESGEVLTIPAALVRELRLAAEGVGASKPRQAPSGLREVEPQVLAGPPEPAPPPRVEEQVAALGEPARFPKPVFDPNWYPRSEWSLDPSRNDFRPTRWSRSIFDPTWVPASAFDADVDALGRGRAVWTPSILDPTWWPTDGFPRRPPAESAQPAELGADLGAAGAAPPAAVQFTPARELTGSRPSPVDAAACAREIFRALPDRGRAPAPEVTLVDDPALEPLGIRLHAAHVDSRGRTYRALFVTGVGVCRLLGGDLGALLGLELDEATAAEHVLGVLRAARAEAGAAAPAGGQDALRFAYAVSRLLDPAAAGREGAAELLGTPADLERIAAAAPEGCTLSLRRRRREIERSLAEVAAPTARAGDDGDVLAFDSWSRTEGAVVHNVVRIAPDGELSLERRTLATHVGAHRDGEQRR